MTVSTTSTIQGAAYGFINPAEILTVDGLWETKTQRPFRGYWLWAWGSGHLTALELGGEQWLVTEAPLLAFDRGVPPEQFLAFVAWKHDPQADDFSLNLCGNAVRTDILHGFGHAALQLPSLPVGKSVALRYRGLVRGIVLVGIQIP